MGGHCVPDCGVRFGSAIESHIDDEVGREAQCLDGSAFIDKGKYPNRFAAVNMPWEPENVFGNQNMDIGAHTRQGSESSERRGTLRHRPVKGKGKETNTVSFTYGNESVSTFRNKNPHIPTESAVDQEGYGPNTMDTRGSFEQTTFSRPSGSQNFGSLAGASSADVYINKASLHDGRDPKSFASKFQESPTPRQRITNPLHSSSRGEYSTIKNQDKFTYRDASMSFICGDQVIKPHIGGVYPQTTNQSNHTPKHPSTRPQRVTPQGQQYSPPSQIEHYRSHKIGRLPDEDDISNIHLPPGPMQQQHSADLQYLGYRVRNGPLVFVRERGHDYGQHSGCEYRIDQAPYHCQHSYTDRGVRPHNPNTAQTGCVAPMTPIIAHGDVCSQVRPRSH
jgi:hypothetical protein